MQLAGFPLTAYLSCQRHISPISSLLGTSRFPSEGRAQRRPCLRTSLPSALPFGLHSQWLDTKVTRRSENLNDRKRCRSSPVGFHAQTGRPGPFSLRTPNASSAARPESPKDLKTGTAAGITRWRCGKLPDDRTSSRLVGPQISCSPTSPSKTGHFPGIILSE